MTSSLAGRILVVDDHDLNLKLLQRVLELDGHRVTAVSTLGAAERAIAHEVPELVVLDLNLPDGDGLGLARKIKSDPRTARCAILACTAGAMKEIATERSRRDATPTCPSRSTPGSSARWPDRC